MALRLSDKVVRGEFFNVRKNTVHGWIQLEGEERPLMLDLTGNCDPDLAGWQFRFEARPQVNLGWDQDDEDEGPDLSKIAWHQIGPTGEMTAARRVKHADCSAKELWMRAKAKELPPMRWVRCLYLEWYSQNGRVVVELVDPILEFVERKKLEGVPMAETQVDPVEPEPVSDEPPDESEGIPALDITTFRINEEGKTEISHETYAAGENSQDDPDRGEFGLIPEDLQRSLDAQAADVDRAIGGEDTSDEIRELELMDQLIESGEQAPLCSIFEEPMQLPKPEDLDDDEVEGVLKNLLGQMALFGVAFHICEHFTPRKAYKLLVEKVFWEEGVFDQLRGTGWVQGFMTSEYCPECEATQENEEE